MAYTCEQCGEDFIKPSLLAGHRRTENHWRKYSCETCGKLFTRRNDWNRHQARHLDSTQYHCSDCGKTFSRPDDLARHRDEVHLQIGRGQKRAAEDSVGPDPKRMPAMDDPRAYYDIKKTKEKHMEKFKTTSTTYVATFKDIDVRGLEEILKTLKRIFAAIIDDVTDFAKPTDLIRMVVQCPELDYPIVLPFMKKAELTVERFLSEIERVLQSYEQFVLDSTLEIVITHVRMPDGAGRRRKYVDLEKFLKDKKCIIRIQNDDELCCARAIITAKAKIEGHEKWNSIRLGWDTQRQMAEQLHEDTSVPIGRCGVPEIKKFQAVLGGYQIHVVSKELLNSFQYVGPSAEKKIYIYYHDEHYDVITSMPAFLNKSYFCANCRIGYDHKEMHKCNNACHACYKIHETTVWEWIHCRNVTVISGANNATIYTRRRRQAGIVRVKNTTDAASVDKPSNFRHTDEAFFVIVLLMV